MNKTGNRSHVFETQTSCGRWFQDLRLALLRLAKWFFSGRWLVIFFTSEECYTRSWLDVSLPLHVKYSKYRKQSLLYIVLIDGSLLFVSTARPMQPVEFNDPRSRWVNSLLDSYFTTGSRKHTKTACTAFLNSQEAANNPKAFKAATLEHDTRLSPVPQRSLAPVFGLFARPFCTPSWLSRKGMPVV